MKVQSTINLSSEDVMKLVKEYMVAKGITPESVSAEVGYSSEGYGPMERETLCFKGVRVTFTQELKPQP